MSLIFQHPCPKNVNLVLLVVLLNIKEALLYKSLSSILRVIKKITKIRSLAAIKATLKKNTLKGHWNFLFGTHILLTNPVL